MKRFSPLLALSVQFACMTDPDTEIDPDPTPTPGHSVALSDVSVLFPLPDSLADTSLLRLSSPAVGGVVLTEDVFDAMPLAAPQGGPGGTADYGAWRIVAARIDPCFPDARLLETNPSACQGQVRLVAQPLGTAPGGGPFGALDVALHLLYNIDAAEFAAISQRWHAWAELTPETSGDALDIHASLVGAGELAAAFKELLADAVGQVRLAKVTFMRGSPTRWDFGGFDRVGDQLVPIEIFDAGATEQRLEGRNANTPFAITPLTEIADVLSALAGEPTGGPGSPLTLSATGEAVTAGLVMARNLDDPTFGLHPDNVDCVSCHVSGRFQTRAITRLGADANGITAFALEGYNTAMTLPADVTENPAMVRGFGYFNRGPVFSQRTINESAAIAQWLQALTTE